MIARMLRLIGESPPRTRRVAAALAVGVAVLVFLLLTLGEGDKSYSAHAQTRGLDIVFNEEPISGWQLGDMLVCFRRDGADLVVQSQGRGVSPLCDPQLYQVERLVQQEFIWPEASHLQIARVGTAAPLEIDVIESGMPPLVLGGASLPSRSRILVSPQIWADAGTLPLEGQITLGDTPSSGSQLNLIEGSYSINESLIWYNKPVEVVSGVFRSGDVVRMMDGADAGDVFGFIEPAGDGKAGFMATVFSSPGGSRLQLYRYGVADLQIEPSLLDRVLRNPILLALGVLLAVLGAVSSAVQLARWVWFGGEKGA